LNEPETSPSMSPRHFFAIGAIAGATLFCEIALTRLFSVVHFYHGAFLAISLALFGFAVSGVFVFLRADALRRERLDAAIGFYGLAFALSIPVSFYFYLYVGFEPAFAWLGLEGAASVAVIVLDYALLAVPFFCSGVCISLLLFHGAAHANRLYAVDLGASAAGAVLVIPALAVLGGPKSMLLASAIAAAAALPFRASLGSGRAVAPAVLAATLAAAVAAPASSFNDLRIRKHMRAVAKEPIFWNSFSMVGVHPKERVPVRPSSAGGGARFSQRRNIVIDNSVLTQMVGFRGDLDEVDYLRVDFNAAAHRLRSNGRVLIIGAGGGRDILAALVNGQQHVRAVEVNPLVVRMADETFGRFTGRVYSMPKVQKVVGDARSYVANSPERFDVILASLIDTWAASAAGAFALTENLLYTTEAFRDYYDHLEDDGVLSIARWHPWDTPRLLATGLAAWQEAGVVDPRQHAVMLLSGVMKGFGSRVAVLLLTKNPLTPEDLRVIEAFRVESGMTVAMTPEHVADPVVARYLATSAGAEGGDPSGGLDLSPARDERPFFFNTVRPWTQARRMLGLAEAAEGTGFTVNLEATRMLVQLFCAVVLLLALTVLLPLLLRAGAVRGPRHIPVLAYFACLGLGYILIEVGLLQRLILLLGKPVYSLAVILSTMLLASGAGSYWSGRLGRDRLVRRLPVLLAAAAAVLAVYTLFLPDWIRSILGAPFPARLATAVGIVALPAYLMGMPFPSGIRALEGRGGGAMVPWVWGVNGAMSVLASVGGIILAIQFGYTAVFLVGTACYAAAALLFRRWAA